MRYPVLILLLLSVVHSLAQPGTLPSKGSIPSINNPKILKGVRVKDVHQVMVSPDGSTVAIKNDPIMVIDIQKGVLREMPVKWQDISTDNQYCYGLGGTMPDTRPGKPAGSTAYGIKVAGVFTDTAERTLFPKYDILAVDGKAGRMLSVGKRGFGTTEGLYYSDLKTGEPIQTIRSETFRADGYPVIIQANYLLYRGMYTHLLVPLDTGNLVTVENQGFLSFADDNYVYVHPYNSDNNLMAYDRRTGMKTAINEFPGAAKYQMLYASFNNRIYRFDNATATVYEEEVRNNSFTTLSSYKIEGLSLPSSQYWRMVACKGPSLLFVPCRIDSAETIKDAANTATLISLPSGKPSLKISPFFVRTADILAKQQADKKDADERYAKLIAEQEKKKKEAADKKAAECKAAWGNSQYARGITRVYTIAGDRHYVILESYDCEKDKYRVWEPGRDAMVTRLWGAYLTLGGSEFRSISRLGDKQYHTCTDCDGDGSYEVTIYTTKTKDLPWGYFSGIHTKSIRTTATTVNKFCYACEGRGVVLK